MAEMVSIQEGLALFKKDVSRTAQFDIIINHPGGKQHTKKDLIYKFELPNISIQSADEESTSRIRNVAIFSTAQEFRVDYLADSELKNYNDYRIWLEKIFRIEGRYLSYFNEYVTDAQVTFYDVVWKKSKTINLRHMYPKVVTGLRGGHEGSELQTFSVTFWCEIDKIQ